MQTKQREQTESQEESILGGLSLHEFTRQAFEQLVRAEAIRYALKVMGEEVRQLCGERHERKRGTSLAYRGGSEPGTIVVNNQREKIRKPRVRNEHGETSLATYTALHSYEGLGEFVSQLMLGGLTTRGYERGVAGHAAALGVSKSEASREFISESREALNELNSRRLAGMVFWAILIDGLHVSEEAFVIALGVDVHGKKHILGISQGSTENADVVRALLASIKDREIQFTDRIVGVIDGAKALRRGLVDHFGDRIEIQRCAIHKKRNVVARLAKKYHAEFHERFNQAYGCNDLNTAETELRKVEKWLGDVSHNAAESLQEGFADLLTLHRIEMPPALRVSFYTTNLIDSAFANPRYGINRVKRWRKNSDMIKRWLGAHLLDQERRFRRVKGFKEIAGFLARFAGLTQIAIDKEDVA
jgi:transposase-like protein